MESLRPHGRQTVGTAAAGWKFVVSVSCSPRFFFEAKNHVVFSFVGSLLGDLSLFSSFGRPDIFLEDLLVFAKSDIGGGFQRFWDSSFQYS